MPSSNHQTPPGNHQSYPPLPGADAPVPPQATSVENICFEFPGKRTDCLPWRNLLSADCHEQTDKVTLKFRFFAFVATVIFEGADRSLPQRCWQDYLDGRLAVIKEQPGLCCILMERERLGDDFDHVWPFRSQKKKSARAREEAPFP